MGGKSVELHACVGSRRLVHQVTVSRASDGELLELRTKCGSKWRMTRAAAWVRVAKPSDSDRACRRCFPGGRHAD